MPFVRKKRVGEHTYYQLVENHRENGRHRQRVLAHLGNHPTVDDAIEGLKESLARERKSVAIWDELVRKAPSEKKWRTELRDQARKRVAKLEKRLAKLEGFS